MLYARVELYIRDRLTALSKSYVFRTPCTFLCAAFLLSAKPQFYHLIGILALCWVAIETVLLLCLKSYWKSDYSRDVSNKVN